MPQKFSLMYQHNENENWVEIHKTLFELMEYGEPKGMENYTLVNTRQRTGLYDKNGKEVYEEDIVVYKSKHNPDDIERVKLNKTEIEPFCGCTSDYYIESELREIIGNVYENPELLPSNNK